MHRCALVFTIACTSSTHPNHPTSCDLPTGTLHDQVLSLGDGIDDRAYWLHVPSDYDCASPTPLLVDFHGTAGDSPVPPEEANLTDELITFSEAHGVIVARPRSRSSTTDGVATYRWDENPGDVDRNAAFALNLVAALERTYTIDRTRVYASGFSSGSNMVSQFLADPKSPFKGIAPIAGGSWDPLALPSLVDGPRVYMSTGYRDYLWKYARAQITALADAGLPTGRLEFRPGGGAHDLYAWQFDELWDFLDADVQHGGGQLAVPWTQQALPSPADINAFAEDRGTLVAAGADGRVWRLGPRGWNLELDRGSPDFTALCFNGTAAAVGGSTELAFGRSGGRWNATARMPDFEGVIGDVIGGGQVNAASCLDDGHVVVGGDWSAAVAQGRAWGPFHVPAYDGEAQIAGIATSRGGATVVVGYRDHVARGDAGSDAAYPVRHPASPGWWNAVTAIPGGRFWAVGDGGAIIVSGDDGRTWYEQDSGTNENLYAVHFADELHGVAAGRDGTVIVTTDGGAHWTPRPTGLDDYVGAVWVDDTTVWIAGQHGLVATSPLELPIRAP